MPVEERVRLAEAAAGDKPTIDTTFARRLSYVPRPALATTPAPSSLGARFLYDGSTFEGHQRSGQSNYSVQVKLQVRVTPRDLCAHAVERECKRAVGMPNVLVR